MKKTIILSLLLSNLAQASFFDALSNKKEEKFLKADDAFMFFHQSGENNIKLNFLIADEYYLYKEKIKIQDKNGNNIDFKFETPSNTIYDDYFQENIDVFYQNLNIEIQNTDNLDFLKIKYQGCAKGILCYAPQTKIIEQKT